MFSSTPPLGIEIYGYKHYFPSFEDDADDYFKLQISLYLHQYNTKP